MPPTAARAAAPAEPAPAAKRPYSVITAELHAARATLRRMHDASSREWEQHQRHREYEDQVMLARKRHLNLFPGMSEDLLALQYPAPPPFRWDRAAQVLFHSQHYVVAALEAEAGAYGGPELAAALVEAADADAGAA